MGENGIFQKKDCKPFIIKKRRGIGMIGRYSGNLSLRNF